MIPKQIFHIWLGKKQESELAEKCLKSWEKLGYQIIHIKLPLDLPKEQLVKLNDYLRVKLLYENGGIYMDNDIEVVKSFDDLLYKDIFFAREDEEVVNLAVLGAIKGHPFLKDLLDEMDKKWDEPNPVNFSLGTATQVLERHAITPLPTRYFYPYHWTKKFTPDCITPDTYTIHYWNASWTK